MKIKLSKFITDLPALLEAMIVPILVAEPGVGKSQSIEAVVASNPDWGFDVYHPAMGMPSDVKGLPFRIDETQAGFLPYEFMVGIQNAATTHPKGLYVVLIDDLIQATDLMKAAIMQLVECRRINGKAIPDNVRFIMATNDATHNAGGTRVISPLIGRSMVCEIEADAKGWIKWGLETKRIVPEVLYFIQTYPLSLSNFVVTKSIQNIPSPRNWERVSKLLSIGKTDTAYFAGCVGEEEATKFSAFLKTINDLKGVVPQIVQTPDDAPLFNQGNQLDKLYSLGLALAHNANKKNIANIHRYLQRLDGEPMEFIFAQILHFNPDLKETPTYINHATKW
jgi:hypothetical protein